MQTKKVGAALAFVCFSVIVLLFCHGSQPAQGQSRGTRTQTAKKVFAADEIDTRSSRSYVFVRKTGFGHEHAVMGRVKKGEIHLGASKDAGKIVFDITSFVAGTAEARRYIGLKGTASQSTARKVTANMLGKDVLNARQFPTATFTIASALPLKQKKPGGPPQYQLKGTFTLHGVTRPLRFTVKTSDKKEKIHLRGGFSILQTSFGITPFSKAFGTIGVADRLTIYGEIDIAKKETLTQKNTTRK